MELFNFALSYQRLKKRISFKVGVIRNFALPMIYTSVGVILSKTLFDFSGRVVSPLWLTLEIVFTLCVAIGINSLLRALEYHRKCKT